MKEIPSLKVGLLLPFLVYPLLFFGQTPPANKNFKLPEIIPPSPTVANLMHFEEVPVDFYTGQPDITIPLHSKKLSAEITMPIALKYNTQGAKVAERSGWAGTGWSLEAGGTISRTVRGLPDEANNSGIFSLGTGIYNLPLDQFFNYGLLSDTEKNRYLWNVGGTASNKYDSELDLYQFSILGATGRFVVMKQGPNLIPKLLTKNQNVKILITSVTSSYGINGFVIVDANGNRYVFGGNNSIDVTTSTPWSILHYPQSNTDAPNENAPKAGSIYTSAWHLTQVTNGNMQELAKLEYVQRNETYKSYITTTVNKPEFSLSTYLSASMPDDPTVEYNKFVLMPESVESGSTISVVTRKLSKITFRDGTNVSFVSSLNNHPENAGAILQSIEIRSTPGATYPIKKYNLSYETTDLADDQHRLWLVNVAERPKNLTTNTFLSPLNYVLEYYEKEGLPAYGRGDAWGYINADARPSGGTYDLLAYKRGQLQRIIYPTGGVKDFVYEPHSFSYEGNSIIAKTYTDDNPVNTGSYTHNADFSVGAGGASPSYSGNFTIDATQYVTLTSTYSAYRNSFRMYLYKVGSSTAVWTGSDAYANFALGPGTYRYAIHLNPNDFPTGIQYPISISITTRYTKLKTGGYYTQALMGGGVRIKEIAFKEKPTDTSNKRKWTYFYNELRPDDVLASGAIPPPGTFIIFPDVSTPHIKSSGSVDTKVGSMNKTYGYNHKAFLKYPSNGLCAGGTDGQSVPYTVTTNEPNMQLSKGGYVGYKYVRVREEGVGYTAYTYTSAQDFPLPTAVFIHPFKPAPDYDYKRGLLLKKQVYDERGFKLEETENTYDYEYAKDTIGVSYIHTTTACPWVSLYSSYEMYVGGIPSSNPCNVQGNKFCGSQNVAPYSFMNDNLIASWATLESTLKREYFYEGTTPELTETLTEYDYNDINYQVKSERKIVREGTETNTYETRYEFPVESYSASLFDPATEQPVITQMKNVYNVINKPIVISTFKNQKPLLRVVNKYNNFAGFPQIKEIESIKDVTALGEDRVVFGNYDALGNPLEVSLIKNTTTSTAKGTAICYIWGYNETLPVAKIEGSANYAALIAALPAGLIDNIKNASNHLTYNESDLKTHLATLRTILTDAMVTTLIHDPSKGVKEVTDPKGDFFTYGYDNLGRLMWVKDRDGKFVSENFYHYRTE